MVVVAPFMWRHRLHTEQLGSESFRRKCSCGWASSAYQPNTRGRQVAADQAGHHIIDARLFHIRWEVV